MIIYFSNKTLNSLSFNIYYIKFLLRKKTQINFFSETYFNNKIKIN